MTGGGTCAFTDQARHELLAARGGPAERCGLLFGSRDVRDVRVELVVEVDLRGHEASVDAEEDGQAHPVCPVELEPHAARDDGALVRQEHAHDVGDGEQHQVDGEPQLALVGAVPPGNWNSWRSNVARIVCRKNRARSVRERSV